MPVTLKCDMDRQLGNLMRLGVRGMQRSVFVVEGSAVPCWDALLSAKYAADRIAFPRLLRSTIYLPCSVFSHGQLYMAASCVTS